MSFVVVRGGIKVAFEQQVVVDGFVDGIGSVEVQ